MFNPLGKIPVLILDDGTTVYESRFILEYLELKDPDTPLLEGLFVRLSGRPSFRDTTPVVQSITDTMA